MLSFHSNSPVLSVVTLGELSLSPFWVAFVTWVQRDLFQVPVSLKSLSHSRPLLCLPAVLFSVTALPPAPRQPVPCSHQATPAPRAPGKCSVYFVYVDEDLMLKDQISSRVQTTLTCVSLTRFFARLCCVSLSESLETSGAAVGTLIYVVFRSVQRKFVSAGRCR